MPILASVVKEIIELLKASSPLYLTENTVTSTAAGIADWSMEIASWSVDREKADPKAKAMRGEMTNFIRLTKSV